MLGLGGFVWAFSGCEAQAQYLWLEGSRVRDWELWYGGLVDPWHVESSWTGDRTCVPCIGRQIIIRCSSSEALGTSLKIHYQADSCGYWQVPSSLCLLGGVIHSIHVSLFVGVLTTWELGFARVRAEREMDIIIFQEEAGLGSGIP